MFSVGTKVIYKHSGVYEVIAVETPSFVSDSNILYYKLSHIHSSSKETVYVPCDAEGVIRSVSNKDDFEKSLKETKNCTPASFTARQPQMISDHYKNLLSDNSVSSLLSVYKELIIREKQCDESGKKLRQSEAHYLGITERAIGEEYSSAFDEQFSADEAKQKLREFLLG